jgi:hypothetical protein
MNLLVERGGENWRAIGLLSAAVALSACTVTTQAPISPTAISPTVTSPLEMRPLSPTEKAALAKTLSQTLKDSNAVQFKWLPAAANGSGPIGYCGLVNVKSSYGGYVGFRRFFAMISKGPKGDYIKGRIEHIDGIPVTSGDNSTERTRSRLDSPKTTARNGVTRISPEPLKRGSVENPAPTESLR